MKYLIAAWVILTLVVAVSLIVARPARVPGEWIVLSGGEKYTWIGPGAADDQIMPELSYSGIDMQLLRDGTLRVRDTVRGSGRAQQYHERWTRAVEALSQRP